MKNSKGKHTYSSKALETKFKKGDPVIRPNGEEDEIQSLYPVGGKILYILKNKNGFYGESELEHRDQVQNQSI